MDEEEAGGPSPPLSREEALALSPVELLAEGLTLPLPERLREAGPIALVQQLRADGLGKDAIGLWIATLADAADRPEIDADRQLHLYRTLTALKGQHPRLGAWGQALATAVTTPEKANAAVELLALANQAWTLLEMFKNP